MNRVRVSTDAKTANPPPGMVAGADQVTLSHAFLPVAIIASAAIISSGTIIVASRTIVGSTAIIASVAIISSRAIVGSGTVKSARAVVSPRAIVTGPVIIRAGKQAAKDHAGRETADDRAAIMVPVAVVPVVAVPAVITPVTDVDDVRIFNGVGCVDAWKSLCRCYAHEGCDQRNNHDREFSHPLLSCFSPSPFPVSFYKDT
jgi:hypothetical protein